jgi:colicin import membrane protein
MTVERTSDRWISITQSVLLHGAVIGLLGYGWWAYQHRPKPPTQTLAIEGTAIDARMVSVPPPKVEKPPEPPPPEPQPPPPEEDQGPPSPTPEEIAERQKAEQDAEEKRLAEEKAAAEQKAREEAEAREREQQKQAEQKRKAEEEKARARREAELKKSLEAEEKVMAAVSSGALASWQAQITTAIQRRWSKPESARPGLDCTIYVTQVPGGEVVNARVDEAHCNGDQAVKESIVRAVERASPLPPPPDPALFERNLVIRFVPTE